MIHTHNDCEPINVDADETDYGVRFSTVQCEREVEGESEVEVTCEAKHSQEHSGATEVEELRKERVEMEKEVRLKRMELNASYRDNELALRRHQFDTQADLRRQHLDHTRQFLALFADLANSMRKHADHIETMYSDERELGKEKEGQDRENHNHGAT